MWSMRDLTLAIILSVFAFRAAAQDLPKLKTQTVGIKLAYAPTAGAHPAIELVQVPAGTISLTDAKGKTVKHQIKQLWIARYETSWDEYEVFWQKLDLTEEEQRTYYQKTPYDERRTTNPYLPPGDGWGWYGFPANCIEFRAAKRYCAWLSKNTGRRFRLPTEAEWEYACRAGGPPLKPDAKSLDTVAWFAGNADGRTHPIGKKKPNAWGLYDMLGNVGEYVIRDPKDDKGLLAGGSFNDEAKDVQSGARESDTGAWLKNEEEVAPNTSWLNRTVHHVGFRVVMEDPAPQQPQQR
jgi:sulfatase modifying factor 1